MLEINLKVVVNGKEAEKHINRIYSDHPSSSPEDIMQDIVAQCVSKDWDGVRIHNMEMSNQAVPVDRPMFEGGLMGLIPSLPTERKVVIEAELYDEPRGEHTIQGDWEGDWDD